MSKSCNAWIIVKQGRSCVDRTDAKSEGYRGYNVELYYKTIPRIGV